MTATDDDTKKRLNRLERKLAREIKAREEAEQLLEEKSSELYELTRRTQDLAANLQTAEREAAVTSVGQAIAHDMNNLITAISGYSLLLQTQLDDGSESYQRAQRIQQAAEQAAAVVASLDQLTTRKLKLAPLDLGKLIETNVQIAEGLRPSHVQLKIYVDTDLDIISHDIAISRCLINLLKNAFEAIERSGRVTLSAAMALASTCDDYAHEVRFGDPDDTYQAIIEITDNGRGMDAKTLERVFERSFSTKPVLGQHGLGLQSVKYLTDQGLAFVTVSSDPETGTCFRLHLKSPLQETVRNARTGVSKKFEGAIFIIDDDPLVGDMLQATLIHMGYEALWYEYPWQALKDIGHTPPALIITDYNMPEMSGREFAQRAYDINSAIPIVVYSGQAASITEHDLYTAILKKPITAEKLESVVKSLVLG